MQVAIILTNTWADDVNTTIFGSKQISALIFAKALSLKVDLNGIY